MFNIWENDQINYREAADKLFNLPAWQQGSTEGQQMVPFLGAGVSLSARLATEKSEVGDEFPDVESIENCCNTLGLDGASAKTFMRMAIFLAFYLQAAEKDPHNLSDDQLLDTLQSDTYPPSGGELARLFASLSTYTTFRQVVATLKPLFPEGLISATEREQIEMFKLLAKITRIADPPDPLTSIASYYENKNGRSSLWTNLRLVISGKRETTFTHRLLAAAAKRHLAQPGVWQDDYLILTTNYDCLMEDALDDAGVDYAVLTTRKSDQKVLVRFSEGITDAPIFTKRNADKYPNQLYLYKPKNLAVIYKVHGCLNVTEKDDGVVISDNDYIDYISQMNSTNGTIPACVNTLMQDKPFLFLGYRLNDWNVRSVFETIRKKRGEDFRGQDYSVMTSIGEYERLFFQRNDVSILKTDLNSFSVGTATVLQALKDKNAERWGNLVDSILSVVLPTTNNEKVANATR